MARAKKITQNINKDAGLMDLPEVKVPHSQWETKWSNYITSNIGDIVPIYVDEVIASEKRRITAGMLSHMTTPMAPIFNAQYTELRTFFVPYRLCADLLAGYKTRKSPWLKVNGIDNASTNAQIIVPLQDQKLPSISGALGYDFFNNFKPFGGLADSLDYEFPSMSGSGVTATYFSKFNLLDFAAYELIYQKGYRNANRESATSSPLYRWLFDIYNRQNSSSISYAGCDSFHIAQREKDYYTGSQPFTQKASAPISVGIAGKAPIIAPGVQSSTTFDSISASKQLSGEPAVVGGNVGTDFQALYAELGSASGIDIENLRLMIKTQELLEKDMMYSDGSYASYLNAHFGTAPMSLVLEEPLELKKVTIASEMQAIFQTSTTANEQTILGTIGANATTQSKEFEIMPLTEFKEPGLIMICAVHKAQNSYDALHYKPKRIFKQHRFDFYTPELNDLGYQPVTRKEFYASGHTNQNFDEAVSFNEAFGEYRYKFNRVHGMFEPSRANALDYWTLAISGYSDVESLYKQSVTELDRALSIKSVADPQFFDAYGFVEYNDKPMSLHSIPGMDGVI